MILHKSRVNFISLKNPDSEQVVNNLIKQFARVYEIVKCYGPWATLKIIDCPLLSISQWNGSKGHENPDQFKDFVAYPNLKTLCKAILSEKGANKTIISILKVSETNEIIDTTASLVADECRRLCKRYSGSIQML